MDIIDPTKMCAAVRKNRSYKKIPLTLKIFFIVSQICFGINFGFTSILRRKYRRPAQIVTLVASFTMIAFLFAPINYLYDDHWFWFNCIKYIVFFFILNNLKYNIYNLIVDINELCVIHCYDKTCISIIIIVYFIIIDGVKVIFMGVRCALENNPYCQRVGFPAYFFYIIPVLSLDIIGIAQIIIYYYINCCVKYVKQVLESNMYSKYKLFDDCYRALADCYERIRPLYEYMIILQLAIMVPKAMATIWSLLYYLKSNAHWYSYMTETVFAFHLTIQICTPAIVVEMLNSQVDSIRQILNENILKETDERKIKEIRYTLQLLKTKRLHHLVLRFIPVDIRLLLCLFSLCTSYFIVILQLTHLID